MSKFVERLTHLKGKMKDDDFAAKVGMPKTTLRAYFGGTNPSIENAAKIAHAFGKSIDWLYGSDETLKNVISYSENYVQLPHFYDLASMGNGAVPDESLITGHITVSRDWLVQYVAQTSQVSVIEGRGDSMYPTISDGDLMLVNHDITERDVNRGGIFVITLDGYIMIKRLQHADYGALKIVSDNKDHYEPTIIPENERMQRLIVHGEVFWAGGPLRRR